MLTSLLQENKGKFLLIIGIVVMWLLLLGLFRCYGYSETWELWGVQTQPHVFWDFLLIPGSAESFRHGFEPSVENPFELGHRIFNYPAFWRLFFHTSITQTDALWIGILMLVLYFVGIILFPPDLSVPSAFWMLLIVFSPASMLLYERGNVDLIVFFICVLIILMTAKSAYWASALIIFGAVVKMFPLFGITVLLRESKWKFFLLMIGSLAFMLLYGFLTLNSQSAAWNTTMRGVEASYGTFVLLSRFQQFLPDSFSFTQGMILFEALAVFLIILAVIPAVREPQPPQVLHERNLTAFRMGASIYLGTFLLGNNWDYRLAFLVLVVPQLSQWFQVEKGIHQNIAVAVMAAVVVSCWHFVFLIDIPFLPLDNQIDRIVAFDEFINWLLLPGLAYLLAVSAPDWLRLDLQKVVGIRGKKSFEFQYPARSVW